MVLINRTTLTELREISIPRPAGMDSAEPMVFYASAALPFPLFKATKTEHLDSFMQDGTLQIGTVMDFAHQERVERGMGDINEGSRVIMYSGKHAVFTTGIQITIVNSYVFCCAKEINPILIKKWKATACFAIEDVGFFVEIAKAMSALARFGIVHEVYYGNWMNDPRINKWIDDAWIGHETSEEIQWPHPDALPRITWLKDNDLAYQEEVRAVFEPPTPQDFLAQPTLHVADPAHYEAMQADRLAYLNQHGVLPELKPFLIKVPDARKYVREVPISEIAAL